MKGSETLSVASFISCDRCLLLLIFPNGFLMSLNKALLMELRVLIVLFGALIILVVINAKFLIHLCY